MQDSNYKDRGVQEKDSCKVQDKLLTMFYAAMAEKWLLSTTASSWCTFRYINMDKLNTICQIKLVRFWLIQKQCISSILKSNRSQLLGPPPSQTTTIMKMNKRWIDEMISSSHFYVNESYISYTASCQMAEDSKQPMSTSAWANKKIMSHDLIM